MGSKQVLSNIITVLLAVGLCVAIVDSVKKSRTPAEKNSISVEEPKKTERIKARPLPADFPSPQQKQLLVRSQGVNEASKQNITIPPLKPYFIGKLPENATVHAIGVYEGEPDNKEDDKPWWSHCEGLHDDPVAMAACRDKYSSTNVQRKIRVHLTYSKSPVVLVLMGYSPVLWSIDMSYNVELAGVILAGYHKQKILGIPSKVPVVACTRETPDCENCIRGEGYFYSYKRDKSLDKVAGKLFEMTGKQLSSFQGSYRANYFKISNLSD